MNIGEKIFKLRKEKNMSQEEFGNMLNVSRQTVSKWELGESTPDFNKIVPICDIFGISTEELLRDVQEDNDSESSIQKQEEKKADVIKAILISVSIFLYFLALVSTTILEEVVRANDGIISSSFLLISGIATALLVFTLLSRRKIKDDDKVKEEKEEKKGKNEFLDRIVGIFMLIVTAVYLLVSFATQAWYITWILWIVAAIGVEIIKLVFYLKEGDKNE